MILRLKLFTFSLASGIFLIFFLCLGSQNLDKRYSLNLLANESVQLPVGFIVGVSFTFGVVSGGLTSVLTMKDDFNQ